MGKGGGYWLGLQEKGLEFLALPSPSHKTRGRGFIFFHLLVSSARLCVLCVPRALALGLCPAWDTSRGQRETILQAEGCSQMESSLLAVQDPDADRRRGLCNNLQEEEGCESASCQGRVKVSALWEVSLLGARVTAARQRGLAPGCVPCCVLKPGSLCPAECSRKDPEWDLPMLPLEASRGT